ncbi:MAG: hypothetical protein KC506_00305 [Nanoarchaeota archaeon]|nr:hypothetical protein [Nanoarchaeota archaeon]
MKLAPYIEKLEGSENYKNFKIKYPKSFLIAGFFVLDLEENKNVHQIDFYVPEEKKIAAFSLDGEEVELKLLETLNDKVPEELNLQTNVDLDALKGILSDEMHNRGMSEDIRKIIAVIQNVKGKKIWNLNCVLTGMEILKSHVEDDSQTVLKIEKASIMDIMKKMPNPKMAMPKSQLNSPIQGSKEDIEGEINKLDKIEAELEKAKKQLEKELAENKK